MGGLVVAWSCGLVHVVKALVAHASDPGSIPGDSMQIFHLLSFLRLCKSKQLPISTHQAA